MSAYKEYLQRMPRRHPGFVVRSLAAASIRLAAAKYLRGRMIEIGCGDKSKGLVVGEYVEKHIGIDVPTSPHDLGKIDVIASAYQMPFRCSSIDCALSTAVLEHLEEPKLALAEAFRVLKPGGYAIYTVPFFWHLHEVPRDFFRYSRFGLDHILSSAGFEVIEISALGGFFVTFWTERNYFLQRFRKGILIPFIDFLVIASGLVMPVLDRISILRDERFAWMHIVVVRKPECCDGS